jgi:transketolase
LSHHPVIYVFTHDSIGVGEDGPTHQPVEHLAALRAIPNLWVMRPADAAETAVAWQVALAQQSHPTALILSRQKLPLYDRQRYAPAQMAAKGAYVLREAQGGTPAAIVIASGSEVAIAMAAADQLEAQGIDTRVVSMPCHALFEAQSADYKSRVLIYCQKNKLTINFVIEKESEKNNAPFYDIVIQIGNEFFGKGNGTSKKNAEQEASKMTLELLGEI